LANTKGCGNKGDPQKILSFLKTIEPLNEESAKKMIAEIEEGRKRAVQRNSDCGDGSLKE
jgi:hypothetical protein